MTHASVDGPFRKRHRVADGGVVAVVAVVVLVLGLTSSRPGGARVGRPDATVTIDARLGRGRALPAGFLGLSLEYSAIEPYAGYDPGAIDPVFAQLVRNLAPGQAPRLRIGGDSTDGTWWPVAGRTAPPGVTFTLDQRWLRVTRALAAKLSARLVLGINLEAGSPTLAGAEAGALVGGIGAGSIEALELGNEPDLYGHFAWYRTRDGRPVTGRPAAYDPNAFTSDFATVAGALPLVPLAGPAFGSFAWTRQLAGFLSHQARLRLVTLHRYPLQSCFVPRSSARYPTINHLLSAAASTGLADSFAPAAAIAHAHRAPLRIDELNTVSCGAPGAPGAVSASFASALWALDALFELARAGSDGVNVHTFPGAGYELFRINRVDGRWRASVAAEYYGLLMFAEAAPAGSRLLGLAPLAAGRLKLWVTRAPDGRIRVVLINKDIARAHVVALRRPGEAEAGAATLIRLQAPSVAARGGVTLGGQSFGTTTDTGALRGPVRTETLDPAGGAYVAALPPGSAALLTLPPRRGGGG
jgi:hypothetical protein